MGKAFTSVFSSAMTLCKWAPQVVHGEIWSAGLLTRTLITYNSKTSPVELQFSVDTEYCLNP